MKELLDFSAQSEILQKWQPVAYLDKGQFSRIFKVVNRQTGALGALKFVPNPLEAADCWPENTPEGEFYLSRFKFSQQEAEIMHRFHGDSNIVQYCEQPEFLRRTFWNSQGKQLVQYAVLICMPLYHNYKEWLPAVCGDRRRSIQVGMDIAKALMAFEQKGVFHRDIKPGNIMMDDAGTFYLGDVGEAKLESELTTLGFHGTRPYMAPEVRKQENEHTKMRSDHRSDIYSLGIILYRLFNRQQFPFLTEEGTLTEEATHMYQRKKQHDLQTYLPASERAHSLRYEGQKLPKPAEADDALAKVILRACAYDRKDRYQTAAELYLALEKCLNQPSDIPPKPEPKPAPDRSGCMKAVIAASAAAIFVIAIVCAFLLGRDSTGGGFPPPTATAKVTSTAKPAATAKTTATSTVKPSVKPSVNPTATPTDAAVVNTKPHTVVKSISGKRYELATMEVPEGYVKVQIDGAAGAALGTQNVEFVSQNTKQNIERFFVSAVDGKNGATMVKTLTNIPDYLSSMHTGEIFIGGHMVAYLYGHDKAAGEEYTASLTMYIDTLQNSSVVIGCDSRTMAKNKLPTEEQMIAEADIILRCLHMNYAKDGSSVSKTPTATATPAPVFSPDPASAMFTTRTTRDQQLELYGYTGDDEYVIVPEKINGYTLVSVDDHAFSQNSSIISVSLPATINQLGEYAFFNCTALKKVVIPANAGISVIEPNTFNGCTSLASISLPHSVEKIDSSAFRDCQSLTQISWSTTNGLTQIGNSAFKGCSSLTELALPEGMESIGNDAFSGCSALSVISMPGSLLHVGDNSFYNCTSLTHVQLPSSLTSLGSKVFYGCTALRSVVIPPSVQRIGNEAFKKCGNVVLYVTPGSYAEKFAKKEKISYKYTDELEMSVSASSVLRRWNGSSYQHVTFGEYPQQGTQPQPIVWRVLDVQFGAALLLSEYALDAMPFDSNSNRWEGSDLCNWLNGDFLAAAFPASAQQSALIMSNEPGRVFQIDVPNKVFLLSVSDYRNTDYGFAMQTNAEDSNRVAYGTDYAVRNGLFVDEGACNYFTKSSSAQDKSYKYQIRTSGSIGFADYKRSNVGIRPAVWLDMENMAVVSGTGTLTQPYVLSCQEVSDTTQTAALTSNAIEQHLSIAETNIAWRFLDQSSVPVSVQQLENGTLYQANGFRALILNDSEAWFSLKDERLKESYTEPAGCEDKYVNSWSISMKDSVTTKKLGVALVHLGTGTAGTSLRPEQMHPCVENHKLDGSSWTLRNEWIKSFELRNQNTFVWHVLLPKEAEFSFRNITSFVCDIQLADSYRNISTVFQF